MSYSVRNSFDWKRVARLMLVSRELDRIEETELYPKKKIAYQFSARGHELGQILLGTLLSHPKDAASAYYRSRPLLLTLGLDAEEALAGPLGKSGGFSDGRDIGVVCNLPSRGGATVLPMAGDVGSQYTPAAGWAAGIRYHREVLQDSAYDGAIAAVLGGEGSVATNGFWSALTTATTEKLPMLFFIEDNGYAISVPSHKQTPGGNIVENLRSFRNLHLYTGDGTNPDEAAELMRVVVEYVRRAQAPALLRLKVPRLSGHSGQDTQAYKSPEEIAEEQRRDPLEQLRRYCVPESCSEDDWQMLQAQAREEVERALAAALARPEPDAARITSCVFGDRVARAATEPLTSGARINMGEAIRRALASELEANPRLLVFGEDVAAKGGVHAVTLGLQESFGPSRVFDTSLSEEGIIGRAVGMALAGLFPVPEIQFRKYADPATEQLHNCGTLRWRTAGKFSAPLVVRLAGGFARRAGDPWHSVTAENDFVHATGWRVVVPSNAADAVGLLRAALRGDDPTLFFEHRALLDAPSSRRPYPGDDYVLPLGVARVVREGSDLTVVTWGGMLERCEAAADSLEESVEIIDLRSLSPWDKECVLASVKKTKRCLVVHEDGITGGFGAEVVATIADEAFFDLDAPIRRLGAPDIPIPYNATLMEATLPTAEKILESMRALVSF